jgi:hypothetical protein
MVWDNGREYSDHCVCFVDVPAGKDSEAEAIAAEVARRVKIYSGGSSRILFMAGEVSWRSGEPMPFEDWRTAMAREVDIYDVDDDSLPEWAVKRT